MHSMFDQRQWLAWLVKVRILVLTCLLGIELAIAQLTPSAFPLRLFVNVMLLWYAIAIFYILLLAFWQEYRVLSLLQVLTDLALVSLVIYATGGIDSSFNFLYPLVIIVACILLPRSWAFLTAALAFILYGTVLELTYFEVVPSYSTTHPELKSLQAIILVNLFGYLAVAYLAGQLATKLRQVDVKLKHTSGALEDLQALHENIIQSITGGLITTGLDGHITVVNTAAQKLLDRPDDDLLGQPVNRLFLDPLPQVESERAHAEVRIVAPNGYRKTFRVQVSALAVPEKGTLGYVYTFDDLTEIRRLEREVRMQDRLAAVGRLAAAIAHEIRNPLTSIAGSVGLLSGIPDLSQEHRQLLQIVTRESERLNHIITDFLGYSRGKQYQFKKVDLLPLLEDTLTLLEHRLSAQNSAIRVERKYQLAGAWTLADGDKIKQVFWNFCENAVRAMRDNGTLTVSVEPAGDDWQVNFADTGPGMSPQLIEKIFEPFQSQFEGGTGLGLAIVYQIVQAHEGKVWARSKVGQGSVFVLKLRRLAGAQANPPRDAAVHSAHLGTAALAAGGGARG
ncbi:MAG TPA: ATP-binding protein [Terriglobales bacterium]|jgi:two-component system sensor histidine kinase PilS (NtrC family)|nr:ATP-binding protein [Terriglobales bacterium]